MDWKDWISEIYQYKKPTNDTTKKYLDFEKWSRELRENRTINIETVEDSLKKIVNEDFDGEEQNGDGYVCFQKTLNEFKEYLIQKNSEEYSNVIESIDSINDLINHQVMSIFSEIPDYDNGTVTHSYEEQLKTMHGIIGGLKIEIRDLERKIQTSTSSVIITNIEILGIFIAVVFVLFGIFNLTVEAFSFVNISISRMLFIISCLTFIMFNSVFLLLYAISRFIDKSIAMNCSSKSGGNLCASLAIPARRIGFSSASGNFSVTGVILTIGLPLKVK